MLVKYSKIIQSTSNINQPRRGDAGSQRLEGSSQGGRPRQHERTVRRFCWRQWIYLMDMVSVSVYGDEFYYKLL